MLSSVVKSLAIELCKDYCFLYLAIYGKLLPGFNSPVYPTDEISLQIYSTYLSDNILYLWIVQLEFNNDIVELVDIRSTDDNPALPTTVGSSESTQQDFFS